MRIENYDDVNFDGIDAVCALPWAKVIHKGNGSAQIYIKKYERLTKKATIFISSGQAKGEDPFVLFAGTIKFFRFSICRYLIEDG